MTDATSCSDPAAEDLLVARVGAAQFITLNRQKALNALNLRMIRRLTPQLTCWEKDSSTNIVVLKAAGDKAFCSGGDLKSIYHSHQEGGHYAQHFFYEEFSLNSIIGYYKKPLVSLLNGITFGGAAGLTVVGRLCVCSERAVFCMPECAIGLFPDVGSGYFLSHLPGHLGLFMGLTGYRLRGRNIVQAGLGSHFVLSKFFPELETAFSELESSSFDRVSQILNQFQEKSVEENDQAFCLQEHLGRITHCFGADSVEGVVDRLREDGSDWAAEQIDRMMEMSPTSLKLTFRLLREGVGRCLAETLIVEYRLTQRCVADHDFMEGIRAVIVDKDNKPRWKPATLAEVTEERLKSYFDLFENEEELTLPDGSC